MEPRCKLNTKHQITKARQAPSCLDRSAPNSASTSCYRKVDIRPHGKDESNSYRARPVYIDDLDDKVDSDQQVVNKEISLWQPGNCTST